MYKRSDHTSAKKVLLMCWKRKREISHWTLPTADIRDDGDGVGAKLRDKHSSMKTDSDFRREI